MFRFQTAFDLIFGKFCCNFLYNGFGCIYARRQWGPDSMKCMHMPSSKCVLFWFFSIQLLKKHTLNPEMTLLCQIHAQKALFKVDYHDLKCQCPQCKWARIRMFITSLICSAAHQHSDQYHLHITPTPHQESGKANYIPLTKETSNIKRYFDLKYKHYTSKQKVSISLGK